MKNLLFITAILLMMNSPLLSQSGETDETFEALIRNHKITLEASASLDTIIALSESKKVVLLGEATHGTSEFYAWRDSISRRLITEKGFRFILVEGDWASIFKLNRYVKGETGFSSATEVVKEFDRWPPWMWRNEEVAALAEWIREINLDRDPDEMIGFYGMDVYDEWNSYDEIMDFLAEYEKELHDAISDFYQCMKIFGRDSWQYASATTAGYESCAPKLRQAFEHLDDQLSADEELHPYDLLYIMQNARVFKNAEKFFRKSVSDRSASWNSRVQHMFHTLLSLLDFHGEQAKAIVWAHNTHIGDARYTQMSNQNQVNIGQLTREYFEPENVLLIGFGTYSGKVTAGRQWGTEMLRLNLPEAMPGSLEAQLHNAFAGDYFLVMNPELREHPYLNSSIGHRAAGVVYNPEHEQPGNYVPTIAGSRYDVFIFIENTNPLQYVE